MVGARTPLLAALIITIVLGVALAGCTTTDGPDDAADDINESNTTDPDQSNETNETDVGDENESESEDEGKSDTDTDTDDDQPDSDDQTDESDQQDQDQDQDREDDTTELNGEEEPIDDGDDQDQQDQDQDQQPDESDEPDQDQPDENETDEPAANETDDRETYTLTVEADAAVTVTEATRTEQDGLTVTKEPDNGVATFEVPEGRYDIEADGYHDTLIPVTVDSDMAVKLQEESGTVNISVVDSETGEPIEGATIRSDMCNLYFTGGDASLQGESDENGVIEAEATAKPTACDARVDADGYETEYVRVFVPDSEGMTVELTPEQEQEYTVTFNVTDTTTGEPIENVTVAGQQVNGSATFEAVTDANGTATVAIPEGTYDVKLDSPQGRYTPHTLTVEIDRDVTIHTDMIAEDAPEHEDPIPPKYDWVSYGPDEEHVWMFTDPVADEPAPTIANDSDFEDHLRESGIEVQRVERDADNESVLHVEYERDDFALQNRRYDADETWDIAAHEIGNVTEAYWGWYRTAEAGNATVAPPERIEVAVYGEDGQLLYTYHYERKWIETFDELYHQQEEVMTYPREELTFQITGALETHHHPPKDDQDQDRGQGRIVAPA